MARIAIIGAGISGLTAARRLHDAGHDCLVLEKSRGLGGRMATRRTDGLSFDHGAQYFTARGAGFCRQIKTWQEQGVVAAWGSDRLVGHPDMTAPAGALAAPLEVSRNSRVESLRRSDGVWYLQVESMPEHAGLEGPFDAVLLALPAPQAAELAATAGTGFAALAGVRYAPCIALMAAVEGRTDLHETSRELYGQPLAWVARNGTKPGRNAESETLVAHAGPDWSREHIQEDPDQLAHPLLSALRPLLGSARLLQHQVHRWLYARVEQAAGRPCLWDAGQRLGACGDWALGPRVESAFDSGQALADAVLENLPALHRGTP
ncbi:MULTISPECIES: NAD(P)/FAD-dependent oxidoreductase [unclassified Thioalkalivibrio]|uniref:NAD(P)/FAD-dependent oxidoreductase n=1 Tax=unclassified Thioalkalivibrio TaxID=2621013 RepID=UPI00037286CC|nr:MULTISPECIES: FAD-dependent oxidoreductase [unclassified Thioalkalivibrio]